jgi:hypothetical protein
VARFRSELEAHEASKEQIEEFCLAMVVPLHGHVAGLPAWASAMVSLAEITLDKVHVKN